MGVNDPAENLDNPLFHKGRAEYNDRDDELLPTVNMARMDVQIIESKHIQTDHGANISICTERYLLYDYTPITLFNIGHASATGLPLTSIGKGYTDIITKQGMTIKTPIYHLPNATGTLLSPDFMCSESNGAYT